ncbi:DNA repair protein RecO [Roseobacter denitrificans]|uniref:DNA repair protein RecO n=1 Tax=Roseobacter denitrificans (strain ATCC 33942 / OCh 114) TaxID=375451 RepID=RECO_ROSDO|nr:DNA repair protein RecO [Roseobacter denitrificans]Q16AI3.1 RecName: Full=DNA repair protein RecO; AltName: Full=Recombination protein O [Roseobacter denitrificans OCh 114]ABG31010.1 DNA repair protein RecO [Roseobacter denitrificans OCh 114]AVL54089.1 DNA repair protein RecO [Roseobacter denitrificans]SFG12605.1 DNA replication and repair protein RecO [Roseobacter denitrificans OCh 114]
MEWREEGILLSTRRHGESAAIIEVFTPSHGRHAGVVRGGTSRKIAPILQPGAQLDLTWRARLEDHIGSFLVEPVRSRAAAAMGDRLALAGLNAVTALLGFCLPEREAHRPLYVETERLLDLLGEGEIWPLAYLRWEVQLLHDMGYALALEACAVTGQRDDLIYVSPKSGRAVSAKGAGDWADRLLPLPPILRGIGGGPDAEIAQAFITTGYFLTEHLARDLGGKPLPEARARFVETFSRRL